MRVPLQTVDMGDSFSVPLHVRVAGAHLLDLGQRDGGELGAYVGDRAGAPLADEDLLVVHERDGAQALGEAAAVHHLARDVVRLLQVARAGRADVGLPQNQALRTPACSAQALKAAIKVKSPACRHANIWLPNDLSWQIHGALMLLIHQTSTLRGQSEHDTTL